MDHYVMGTIYWSLSDVKLLSLIET